MTRGLAKNGASSSVFVRIEFVAAGHHDDPRRERVYNVDRAGMGVEHRAKGAVDGRRLIGSSTAQDDAALLEFGFLRSKVDEPTACAFGDATVPSAASIRTSDTSAARRLSHARTERSVPRTRSSDSCGSPTSPSPSAVCRRLACGS